MGSQPVSQQLFDCARAVVSEGDVTTTNDQSRVDGVPSDRPMGSTASSNVPSRASDLVMSADHPTPASGGPCATCAFRIGTQANLSPHTVELARLCVEGFREFYCHERPQVCRGFNAAINLRGVPQGEDDRRWSEVAGMAADVLQQCIEAAKAADAVDPHVGSTGKPTPRV